jgi:hypothetical protein
MDILFAGLVVALLASTWALLRLCERLLGGEG